MEWLIFLGLVGLIGLRKPIIKTLEKGASKTVEQIIAKSANRLAFHKMFLDAAKNVDWKNIPPKFGLALSDVESGAGTGSVYVKTRNLFSITKGSTWTGPVYRAGSGLDFRIYRTLEESMADWVKLLHKPIYGKALAAALSGDFPMFAAEIKKAGYDASEPKYAAILVDRFKAIKEV